MGAKQGAKAVALGAAATMKDGWNVMRHSGDNKIHLKSLMNGLAPGCIRWQTGRRRGTLAYLVDGMLHQYSMKHTVERGKKNGIYTQTAVSMAVDPIILPRFPDDTLSPAALVVLAPKSQGADNDGEEIFDHWWRYVQLSSSSGIRPPLNAAAAGVRSRSPTLKENPFANAEIETNPPYQPFHTDHRINLSVYRSEDSHTRNGHSEIDWEARLCGMEGSCNDANEQWVFGEDIPTVTVKTSTPGHSEDADDASTGNVAGADGFSGGVMKNHVERRDGDDDTVEQIIVTTRRKRNRRAAGEAEDDGFFEEDCDILDFAEDRV